MENKKKERRREVEKERGEKGETNEQGAWKDPMGEHPCSQSYP